MTSQRNTLAIRLSEVRKTNRQVWKASSPGKDCEGERTTDTARKHPQLAGKEGKDGEREQRRRTAKKHIKNIDELRSVRKDGGRAGIKGHGLHSRDSNHGEQSQKKQKAKEEARRDRHVAQQQRPNAKSRYRKKIPPTETASIQARRESRASENADKCNNGAEAKDVEQV